MSLQRKVSNCCGVPAPLGVDGYEESGFCAECHDHCTYVHELIYDGSAEHDLLNALDIYSMSAGDVELTNVLNNWFIKKLNKRMELHDIH